MAAIKRVNKEYLDLLNNPHPDFTIERHLENGLKLNIILNGPIDTPYEGGVFYFEISFPSDYPFKPLKIQLLTEMYHPQFIKKTICCCQLDSLGDNWSPAKTTLTIFNEILALMITPDFNNPCVGDEFKGKKIDYNEFVKKAKEWTLKYAI